MSTGIFNKNRLQGGIFGNAIVKTISLNPSNLSDGAGETLTNDTFEGAAVGDFVFFAPGVNLAGITVTAYVSAADTVAFRIQNESGGGVDLAASNWKVAVVKAGRAFG
jgi:hypothetical protein